MCKPALSARLENRHSFIIWSDVGSQGDVTIRLRAHAALNTGVSTADRLTGSRRFIRDRDNMDTLPMALLRLVRSEAFRLVAMGFLIGSAGIMLTQPSQAQSRAESSVINP